ncbi:MAG TPA: hypothetical protein VEQ41_08685 [Solirubrobacterales bacterium]|nr:hypothetical protein [Solirubrobacterales bacterium]
MSSYKLPPEGRPPSSAADAARRLATIVDAAERAAANVIDEAEREAERHLEEARARADGMVAERLRELADELDPPAARERREAPHLRPVGDSDGLGDGPAPRRSGSAGARLLATQMAVSGARREEIEARLRSGFEIEDTDEILDAILGPRE